MDGSNIRGSVSPGKGTKFKKELAQIQQENEALKATVSDLQYESNKNNLIFYGIFDSPDENVKDLLNGFVRDELKVRKKIAFRRVHRMNSKHKPRPIIATFDDFRDRELVRSSAHRLKGSSLGVSEQYPPNVQRARKRLVPILRQAKRQRLKAVLIKDKLYIENELFDPTKHEVHRKLEREAMHNAEPMVARNLQDDGGGDQRDDSRKVDTSQTIPKVPDTDAK